MKTIIKITIACIIFYIASTNRVRSDFFVEATSIFIILFSTFCIFRKRQPPFSLYKMFNLFNLFFFGFAPWLQFINKVTFWRLDTIPTSLYQITNVIIIVLIIIFNSVYALSFTKNNRQIIDKIEVTQKSLTVSKLNLIILLIVSVIAFIFTFFMHDYNVMQLLLRGMEGANTKEIGITDQIANNFIRPMPMIIFIFYLMCRKPNVIMAFILGALAIITVPPTGVASLFAAATYIPLLLVTLPIMRKGEIFTTCFILGLLIIFPFLNNFRHFNIDNEIGFEVNVDMFLEGHFDAYQNFASILGSETITYGQQLLGAIFFFVPRSIWPQKPVGSGYMIAQTENYSLENISMPFLAEGYINFGIIGSIIFVIVLALFCKKLDMQYWYRSNYTNLTFNIQYLFLCGLSFFILRGDMMNGIAYTTGIMISIYLVSKLTGRAS